MRIRRPKTFTLTLTPLRSTRYKTFNGCEGYTLVLRFVPAEVPAEGGVLLLANPLAWSMLIQTHTHAQQ